MNTVPLVLCVWLAYAQILISQMGDSSFEVRHEANRQLLRLAQSDEGRYLLPLLENAAQHPDPEIAQRVRWTISQYYVVRPTSSSPLPWIDMLPESTPDRSMIINKYIDQARYEGWLRPYDEDCFHYRIATALYTRQLIKDGMLRSEVRQLLDKMVTIELEWRAKNKWYPPTEACR